MDFIKHFLPNTHDQNVPLILHLRHLGALNALVIIAKVLAVLVLFVVYPSQGYFSTVTSATIVELTNQRREAAGLRRLVVNEQLNQVAQKKLNDMLQRQFFSHTNPDGEKVWGLLTSEGYDYTFAGENLAMNFYSAEEVVSAWMDSEKHRQNLLSQQFQDIGVAVGIGTLNDNSVSLVVQIFGTEVAGSELSFRSSVSSILGIETSGIEIRGDSDAVTLGPRKGSWLRMVVENYKTSFLFVGLFLSVSVLAFAFYESKHHHRRLALGLATLGIVFMAILVNGHFLEEIRGVLTLG